MTQTRTSVDQRAPAIELARIRAIRTIEVLDHDVEGLAHAFSAETTALGFFTALSSTWVSAGLGWLASTGLSPVLHGVFATVTFTSAVLSAWFFAQWRLAHRQRTSLLQQFREQTSRPRGRRAAPRPPALLGAAVVIAK